MLRNGTLKWLSLYFSLLVLASFAHAQTTPPPSVDQSFNDWFWNSMDWHSFGSAALAGLLGGALRTMSTLRNMAPTFRVFLETLGDAITAFISGFVVFLLLLVWQSYTGKSVNHVVTFVTALVAGWLRGGFISWFDELIKRALVLVTDLFLTSLTALAKRSVGETPAPPTPPADPTTPQEELP